MRSLTKIVLITTAVVGLGALATGGVLRACGSTCAASTTKASQAGAKAKPATSATAVLEVSGMHCEVCPITVRKALEAVPGVKKAAVSFVPPRATVVYDPSRATPDRLIKATTDAGYPSQLRAKN